MSQKDPFDLNHTRKLLEDFYNYKKPEFELKEIDDEWQQWIEVLHIQQWAVDKYKFFIGHSWTGKGYHTVLISDVEMLRPLEVKSHIFQTALQAMIFGIHTCFASFLSAALKAGNLPGDKINLN